jgi:hypothetical protein
MIGTLQKLQTGMLKLQSCGLMELFITGLNPALVHLKGTLLLKE